MPWTLRLSANSACLSMHDITKDNLEGLYAERFSMESFLGVDPIGIVYELRKHTSCQLDIELGALFTAMISWGNRKCIRKAALHMLRDEMGWHPADFILSGAYRHSYTDARNQCVYRTLNVPTFIQVCENIRQGIQGHDTIEDALRGLSIEESIAAIASWLSPARLGTFGKSACKRICMFLRWMVRESAPDLALWHSKSQRDLYAVMDVHVCQLTASILSRKQADWRTCQELTSIFRSWNPHDPLLYDVALMVLADVEQEEQ